MAAPRATKSKLIQGVATGLGGALLALLLYAGGLFQTWESGSWDWRARFLAAPGAATKDIVLVLLDQNSLDWALEVNGLSWPWPREVYGIIVDYCRRSGAKGVAFDVLYTEPSKYGVADDETFGQAVANYGRFATAVFLGEKTGRVRRWPEKTPVPGFTAVGLEAWLKKTGATGFRFPKATFPVPELAAKAKVLGNVQMNPDPDGIYRRVRPMGMFDGKFLPALGLGPYLSQKDSAKIDFEPGGLILDGKRIPTDKEGFTVLRYRGPSGTHRAFSAAAVIQSELRLQSGESPTITDTDAFKDKYVLFGFSAPGLFDLRPAPVGGVYTGVEIQATLLDNFLSGDFMQKAPTWLTVVLAILLAMVFAVAVAFFPSVPAAIGLLFCAMAFPLAGTLVFYKAGFWLPLIVLEAAGVMSLALAFGYNYTTEGRQRRFIKSAFKQYLSPAVIDQIVENPGLLKLGGQRRTLSIFFSDLQGFTSISEGLDPEALTTLLNDYLSAMTDIIHTEEGTVDKYEGDAIIAFWNAPLEVSDHAVRIVRTALACQKKLAELRPEFKKRMGKEMHMRIGINTGPAVVGNLGSKTRFDYTMLGDAVNLAARLEGANKQFGTYTMISESTREMVGDAVTVRELARVAVVGRKEPVTVYEPMFPDIFEDRKEIFENFERGLHLFYDGQFDAAREVFETYADQDPAAASYVNKCRELAGEKLEEWGGVWVMTSK